MSSRFAEPVRMKRPGRRGRSASTSALDGQQQVGFSLHFVQRQARCTADQLVGGNIRPLLGVRVIEGEVKAILRKRLGLNERALASLSCAHHDDDGRDVERAANQGRREAGQKT